MNSSPSHLIGVPPLATTHSTEKWNGVQAETRPIAGAGRFLSQLTPEQPTSSLPICDYCNNPVSSGKHVHERCVERLDAREEAADLESGTLE